MPTTEFIRARVDAKIKQKASAVLEDISLTVSDAVRMTLARIAKENALSFELFTLNAATRVAIKDTRVMIAGKKAQFKSGAEYFDHPHKGAYTGTCECHIGGDFLLI